MTERRQSVYIDNDFFNDTRTFISKIPFVDIVPSEKPIDYYIGQLSPTQNCLPRKGFITTKVPQINLLFEQECVYTFKNQTYFFMRRKKSLPLFTDVSFLIQGMDTSDTLSAMCVAFLYGCIVPSTWNVYNSFDIVEKHVKKYEIYNNQNIFYQIHTVLQGLKNVKTKKVIKLRCDEVYTNLLPIFDSMIDEPNKIITTNIFIRNVFEFPYHCSDHIFGGSVEMIQKLFVGAEHLIHIKVPYKPMLCFKHKFWVPEQILCIGFLISYYPLYALCQENCHVIMNRHFKSVNLLSLSPEIVAYTRWAMNDRKKWTGKKERVTNKELSNHVKTLIDKHSYQFVNL